MSLLPTDPLSITSKKLRSLGQGEVFYNASFAPGVALIELRHPERHNSFSGKMMAQFRDIILKLEQLPFDSDLVAVIMTGCAGKSFCSGIDLAFAQEHMQGDAKETVNRFMHDTLTRFSRLNVITVASMAGAALGGGTELLTAFDYICMDSGTFIRFVQTRMGVSSPWGGARRLVPRIGRKQALRILGSAPVITAVFGHQVGLVDTIVDSGSKEAAYDACLQACLSFVEPFVVDQKSNDRVSPAAVRGMKQLMVRSEDPSDVDYEMFLFNSVVGSSRLSSSSSLRLLSPSRRLSYSARLATQQPAITFIGAGNMAEALMGGLHSSGFQRLRYVEPLESRLLYLQQKYPGIMGLPANEGGHEKALHDADVVILAVKPHQLRQVMPVVSMATTTSDTCRSPLYISIVGGVTIGQIIAWMGKGVLTPVVRCMPNTPALLGEGAFGLYANDAVDQDQRELTDRIMHAVAKTTQWVNTEALIDSVTGVSGSGPAYFFLMMEAMQNAGMEAGLTMEEAKSLTIQTCLGAARMAQQMEGDEDLASLRKKVTSPNGTTEAAIKSMEANFIRKILKEAVFAATQRAHAISKELDQEQE